MEENLKKKVLTGFGILGFSQIFQQVFALISKIILARLLIPDDFGLASMAFIVLSVIGIFGTFGVGSAFVHKKVGKDFEKAKNTLFIMSAFTSIIYFALVLIAAPFVAEFFKVPVLKYMVMVLAFSFLIRILASVPSTIIEKEMMFGRKTAVIMTGTIVSFIITVVLALMGFGAWSIIWGSIGMAVSQAILQFIFAPYIPKFDFSRDIVKEYFNYGKYLTVSKFVGVVISEGDDTIIGRILGVASLGFYNLAAHAATLPMALITGVVNQIMFPLFAKLQGDIERFKRGFIRAFKLGNFLAIPAVAGIVILAPEIVYAVFGEKWMPMVPFIYILGAYGFLNSVSSLNGSVFNAFGKTKIIQQISVVQLILFIVLVYPLIKIWGVGGICFLLVLYSVVGGYIGFSTISSMFPGLVRKLIPVLSLILVNAVVMMAGVYLLKTYVFKADDVLNLILNMASGMVIYFGVSFLVDRRLKNDIKEAIETVLSK